MTILGIETSCDETALALIETHGSGNTLECRVIQSLVHSQAELHSAYGGVFPTLAKREHGKNLAPLLEKTLKDLPLRGTITDQQFKDVIGSFKVELERANPDLWESLSHAEFLKNIPAIDRIAVTEGPGLEPALWVGINFARILGALWNVPIIPVNHMEGHIVGSLLPSDAANGAWQKLHDLPLPSIALLISGGHTELVNSDYSNSILALPNNDWIAFHYPIPSSAKQKTTPWAKPSTRPLDLLGLPYPGGPHIARLAHEAYLEKIPAPIKLPRPMIKSGDLDFSFSGLKTAVLYAVRDEIAKNGENLSDAFKKGLAHEFETAVSDVLDAKLRMAIEKTSAKSIIIGGGVAANHVLRARFEKTAENTVFPFSCLHGTFPEIML